MVCCVCVGLEVHIRHEHRRNRPSINTICFGLTKTETLPVQIGVQRVNEIGVQTVLKKKPEDVVAVVSGSLKPYFYVVCQTGARLYPLQQSLKAVSVVGDGEHIGQHFTF